jgi:hypothetical protein
MQLTEEENQNSILMIGGIKIFLPFAQEEAKACVANEVVTKKERQPTDTIREEELE